MDGIEVRGKGAVLPLKRDEEFEGLRLQASS